MEIKYRNNIEDLVEANMYAFRHSKPSKLYHLAYIWLIPIALLILAIIFRSSTYHIIICLLIALAWLLFYPRIFLLQIRKAIKNKLYKENSEPLGSDILLILTKNGLTKKGIYSETNHTWDSINELVNLENHIVIFIDKLKIISVPKNYFKNPDEIKTFLEYINAHKT